VASHDLSKPLDRPKSGNHGQNHLLSKCQPTKAWPIMNNLVMPNVSTNGNIRAKITKLAAYAEIDSSRFNTLAEFFHRI